MIASRVELMMRRRAVKAFIDADYVMAQFTRDAPLVKTAAGGWTKSGPPQVLLPQKVAIVPGKRRYDHGLINAEAGSIPETEWLLLGLHTLDVAEDDRFSWMGQNYFVKSIHPTRRPGGEVESILCTIDFRGETNG